MASSLHIRRAARIILGGGIVAYPTEAVYGLGCMPDDAEALARIIVLKRRSWHKGLILIAASLEQVSAVAEMPQGPTRMEIEASWPGPITWVLPAKPSLSRLVTGGRSTVAVRVTDHADVQRLCTSIGSALVSTSANLAGRRPARTSLQVRRLLDQHIDYVLPGRVGGRAQPTQIRDAASGRSLR